MYAIVNERSVGQRRPTFSLISDIVASFSSLFVADRHQLLFVMAPIKDGSADDLAIIAGLNV